MFTGSARGRIPAERKVEVLAGVELQKHPRHPEHLVNIEMLPYSVGIWIPDKTSIQMVQSSLIVKWHLDTGLNLSWCLDYHLNTRLLFQWWSDYQTSKSLLFRSHCINLFIINTGKKVYLYLQTLFHSGDPKTGQGCFFKGCNYANSWNVFAISGLKILVFERVVSCQISIHLNIVVCCVPKNSRLIQFSNFKSHHLFSSTSSTHTPY